MFNLKLSRKEILACTLGAMFGIFILAEAIGGFQQHELIIEMRRDRLCFTGILKFIYCTLQIILVPSITYVLYLGSKISKVENKNVGTGSIFIFFLFVISLFGSLICMIIASYSCS